MANIRVMVKRPGEEPEVKEIENDWKIFKELIGGGTLEGVYLGKGLWVYDDDEGKLKGLPYNFNLGLYDFAVGSIVFFRNDYGEEEQSLTDKDIEFLKERLAYGYVPISR